MLARTGQDHDKLEFSATTISLDVATEDCTVKGCTCRVLAGVQTRSTLLTVTLILAQSATIGPHTLLQYSKPGEPGKFVCGELLSHLPTLYDCSMVNSDNQDNEEIPSIGADTSGNGRITRLSSTFAYSTLTSTFQRCALRPLRLEQCHAGSSEIFLRTPVRLAPTPRTARQTTDSP